MKNNDNKDEENLIENLDVTESIEEEVAPKMLEENYKPPSQLHIPLAAKEKFANLGYDLQWARIYVPRTQGELDLNNISKKEADMYEFVTREEIPGLSEKMSGHFKDKIDNQGGLYIVGDQAMVKVPFSRIEAKRKYINQRTKSRSDAVMSDLRNNNVAPDAIPESTNEGPIVPILVPSSLYSISILYIISISIFNSICCFSGNSSPICSFAIFGA